MKKEGVVDFHHRIGANVRENRCQEREQEGALRKSSTILLWLNQSRESQLSPMEWLILSTMAAPGTSQ